MLNDRLNRSSLTGSTRVVIVAVLLAITGAVAAAQNVYTTFSGTVADQQGARISGVTLVLTNAERQAKYEVKTNQAGSFEFVGLPSGVYQLEVAGLGFRKVSEEIKVAAPGVQRNVVLQIGSLSETITVGFNPADPADPAPSPKSEIKEKPAPDHSGCVASPEGGRIVAPRKLKDVAPVYPVSLRSAATEGTVVMQGRIGLDGFITDIQVLGEAHPELVNAAVEAVREWKYSPTLLNCAPVEPAITVTTRFMRMGK